MTVHCPMAIACFSQCPESQSSIEGSGRNRSPVVPWAIRRDLVSPVVIVPDAAAVPGASVPVPPQTPAEGSSFLKDWDFRHFHALSAVVVAGVAIAVVEE